MLSRKQKRKYIKQGGVRCPYCGTDQIEGQGFGADDEGSETVKCLECHKEWVDDWKIFDIRELEPEEV